jgi:hypothetical protein
LALESGAALSVPVARSAAFAEGTAMMPGTKFVIAVIGGTFGLVALMALPLISAR